jgi:hypothetical protein
MMTTLTDFLLARITEDEASAITAGSGSWSWEQGYGEMCNDPECSYGSLMQVKTTDPGGSNGLTQLMDVHGYDIHAGWEGAAHIARWDPFRVLAECEAKRRLVDLHTRETDMGEHRCIALDGDWVTSTYPGGRLCGTLTLLALPYANHPDYREEWRR